MSKCDWFGQHKRRRDKSWTSTSNQYNNQCKTTVAHTQIGQHGELTRYHSCQIIAVKIQSICRAEKKVHEHAAWLVLKNNTRDWGQIIDRHKQTNTTSNAKLLLYLLRFVNMERSEGIVPVNKLLSLRAKSSFIRNKRNIVSGWLPIAIIMFSKNVLT